MYVYEHGHSCVSMSGCIEATVWKKTLDNWTIFNCNFLFFYEMYDENWFE